MKLSKSIFLTVFIGGFLHPNIAKADLFSETTSSTVTGREITLVEAFQLSLKRSESIAQEKDSVAIALAQVDQLGSNIKPHIVLSASELFQPTSSENGSNSPLTKRALTQAQFTLQQPLFSGFREFLAYKAGKRYMKSVDLDEKRAESLLYQDVAQAYLELFRIQNEILIRKSLVSATSARIKQLTEWVNLGRSRHSEAISARSQLAQIEAQIEIARGQEEMAQENLKFLTGLEDNLLPQEISIAPPEPLENLLNLARERSDVQARREDLQVAKFSTLISKRQRWPTIGLTSDYYLKRYGVQSDIHWDALISASLPIYEGGSISAQVRQEKAAEDAAELAVTLAERRVILEVRSAFKNVEWTMSAQKTLNNAVQLAEENAKAQSEDYKLSRVTNLEVLDALNTLENARLILNQIEQQAVFSRIQLDVAVGRL